MDAAIDFDAASAAWRENKKPLGGGWFAYRCQYIHTDGKRCNRAVEAAKKQQKYSIREDWVCKSVGIYSDRYCWQHRISGPTKATAKNILLFSG